MVSCQSLSLPAFLMSGFPFAGASLGACAASMDEPGPEGLTSTSLLDLLLPTDFEPLDSEEPSEAMGLGAGLAPGSGFPSEDSEESRLLQPPQYFWEEEELNGTSLDLGPTAGSSAHFSLCRIPGVVHIGRGRGAVPRPSFSLCCLPGCHPSAIRATSLRLSFSLIAATGYRDPGTMLAAYSPGAGNQWWSKLQRFRP